MSEIHVTKLAALADRIHVIDSELTGLDQKFTDCAVEFDGINAKDALKRASGLEFRMNELRRERTLAVLAQKRVAEEEQHEREQEESGQRRAHEVEAKKHADAIVTLHGELDAALLGLRQLFERRAGLLHLLAQTNIIDSVVVNKLAGKGGPTAAACHAGLHRFLDIVTVAPQSQRPLVSSNQVLALGRGGVERGNGGGKS